MASVSIEGVSKVFAGNVEAVRDLHLEIHDQEFLVLLGPSGCGKSTTLRLIAGLEEVTSGEIRIGDREVTHVAPKDRDIAMVFQNYALYPHMSVYKNMAFGLELRYGGNWFHRTWKRLTSPTEFAEVATKRRGIRDEVRQTAQVMEIEHLLDRMPRQLSGGERQRVALGRATVRHPAVFLFDEPLSNLDAKLRLEMRKELSKLHQRLETTMVYVTHDQTEAMTLGDRIVVMEGGEVRQIGTSMEVYDQPATKFVAGFIGSPPMNFVSGKLTRADDGMRFVSPGLEVSIPEEKEKQFTSGSDEVLLGIRPEDMTVQKHSTVQDHPNETLNFGDISLVEPLGDSTLLYVEIAGGSSQPKNGEITLISKADPRTKFEQGDRVALDIASEHLHLFDPESGQNLTMRG
ncbi:MAG: glycerol-3-phosphate ABC transporter ATP-binding protein [Planctomycetaceae bacterium]|nr:glycerol-3-phosphate ABC transporter ATP-binding protein [Planctomycetaceae bacterium]